MRLSTYHFCVTHVCRMSASTLTLILTLTVTRVKVSSKTTVVNFSVKQLGLEAQLLGIVVQREQPSLEEQSSELTVKVFSGHIDSARLSAELHRSMLIFRAEPVQAHRTCFSL